MVSRSTLRKYNYYTTPKESEILFSYLKQKRVGRTNRVVKDITELETYIANQNEYTYLTELYVNELKNEGLSTNDIAIKLPGDVANFFLDKEELIEKNRKRTNYLKSKYR